MEFIWNDHEIQMECSMWILIYRLFHGFYGGVMEGKDGGGMDGREGWRGNGWEGGMEGEWKGEELMEGG